MPVSTIGRENKEIRAKIIIIEKEKIVSLKR